MTVTLNRTRPSEPQDHNIAAQPHPTSPVNQVQAQPTSAAQEVSRSAPSLQTRADALARFNADSGTAFRADQAHKSLAIDKITNGELKEVATRVDQLAGNRDNRVNWPEINTRMGQILPEYKNNPTTDAEKQNNARLMHEAQMLSWLDETIRAWGE